MAIMFFFFFQMLSIRIYIFINEIIDIFYVCFYSFFYNNNNNNNNNIMIYNMYIMEFFTIKKCTCLFIYMYIYFFY